MQVHASFASTNSQTQVYGALPQLTHQIYHFSLLIRAFFELFLTQKEWFKKVDDGEIILSAHCPPQLLFTFGFLLGAAVIFQQPLPFKVSREYFLLHEGRSWGTIEAFYRKHFPEPVLKSTIYPYSDALLPVITAHLVEPEAMMSFDIDAVDQVKIFAVGLEKFWLGLGAACDLSYFTHTEFYNLIPLSTPLLS
jgi:hypothetical protein